MSCRVRPRRHESVTWIPAGRVLSVHPMIRPDGPAAAARAQPEAGHRGRAAAASPGQAAAQARATASIQATQLPLRIISSAAGPECAELNRPAPAFTSVNCSLELGPNRASPRGPRPCRRDGGGWTAAWVAIAPSIGRHSGSRRSTRRVGAATPSRRRTGSPASSPTRAASIPAPPTHKASRSTPPPPLPLLPPPLPPSHGHLPARRSLHRVSCCVAVERIVLRSSGTQKQVASWLLIVHLTYRAAELKSSQQATATAASVPSRTRPGRGAASRGGGARSRSASLSAGRAGPSCGRRRGRGAPRTRGCR